MALIELKEGSWRWAARDSSVMEVAAAIATTLFRRFAVAAARLFFTDIADDRMIDELLAGWR